MRTSLSLCIVALTLATGCSDTVEDHSPKARSLSDYVNADQPTAADTATSFGKLFRRWDCADIKQTFRQSAGAAAVEIAFEYLDGSSSTETASVARNGDLLNIELHMAEEVTLYTYDILRDTMAWRDINGDSHVCSPA
jgi:hypothetical protein